MHSAKISEGGMPMRALVRAHPVFVFYLLALALTWGQWGALLAMGQTVGPGSAQSHLPGLAGPLLAALLVTALAEGNNGLWDLLVRLIRWPANPVLIGLAILAPPVLFMLVLTGSVIAGAPPPHLIELTLYPGVAAETSPLVMVALIFVFNGLGEETGWRGFMLDRLTPRHGAFVATLIVVPFWAAWHLPVFFLNTAMTALIGPALIGWLVGLFFGAFVLSYLYFVSGRSILAVALWHTAYNLSVAVPAAKGLPAAIISSLVMLAGLYAAIWLWRHPHPENKGFDEPRAF